MSLPPPAPRTDNNPFPTASNDTIEVNSHNQSTAERVVNSDTAEPANSMMSGVSEPTLSVVGLELTQPDEVPVAGNRTTDSNNSQILHSVKTESLSGQLPQNLSRQSSQNLIRPSQVQEPSHTSQVPPVESTQQHISLSQTLPPQIQPHSIQIQPIQQPPLLPQLHNPELLPLPINNRIINPNELDQRSQSMSGLGISNVPSTGVNQGNAGQIRPGNELTGPWASASLPISIRSFHELEMEEAAFKQTLSKLIEQHKVLTRMKLEILNKIRLINPNISLAELETQQPHKRRRLVAPSDGISAPRPAPISHDEDLTRESSVPSIGRESSEKQREIWETRILSEEQQAVMRLVIESRRNVFFTGAAGTGKSVLLRQIIHALREQYTTTDAVAVTAYTGLAACNISGITVHSFAGVGFGKEDTHVLVKRVMGNKRVAKRWRAAKVLVIDEISMVDARFLDKLDQIGRHVRYQPHKPFGGIQLVITGDFYQLPPVPNEGKSAFAFEAECWPSAIDESFELKTVFRQKDPIFINMLAEMRCGNLSNETIDKFVSLKREINHPPGITPMQLFSANNDVINRNKLLLGKLKTRSHNYKSVDSIGAETTVNYLKSIIAPKDLELKVGAQVMMIKDIDDTLVSGTLGTVIGFQPPPPRERYPLGAMNFRSTSHKVSDETRSTILGTEKGWPEVKFFLPSGEIRNQIMTPEIWYLKDNRGGVLASRTQVPLILAWSMTIHKAQGQTLAWLKVDLEKTFEIGQAYVALSRAISLEGLQVLNFRPEKIRVNSKVVAFYRSLMELAKTPRMKLEQTEDPAKDTTGVPPPPAEPL